MFPMILVLILGLSAAPQRPEATSLLGKPLTPPPPSAEARKQLEENLARAEVVYGRNPADADATIWLGRRLAYLGRYRDAIEHFSDGIEKHPDDPRMYRHRGHRHITLRELDRAIADLTRAATLVARRPDEIEPDGQPNARNIPTSTLKTNVFYHLALAHYLKGELEPALEAWDDCLQQSKNADMQVAASHWLYMTLRRLNRTAEAQKLLERISVDMDIIENVAYYKLLLMYKGLQQPESLLAASDTGDLDAVTIGYGVGNWYLYNQQRDKAMDLFKRIIRERERQWPAFGYIAAEAELARAGK